MTRRLSLIIWVLGALAVLAMPNGESRAQGGRIHHVITSNPKAVPYLGRDLWFAVPQNFQKNLDPTRYFYIYISSSRNTTAHIQVGTDPAILRPITANQTTVVTSVSPQSDFSKQVELQSSGIIENKTIHVWSTDADLSVYFLSRAPFTTDGMYVIPTIGWGNDYVVGSYASFLIDVNLADLPSEFVVVANQDNTTVYITPTADIRQDGFPGVVAHPKGQQFQVTLNKGQCVEYQVTATPGDDSWDFSGTHVASDKPVGVIGASVCPNITVSDNTCDHILDMIPPTRIWSNSYFSVPFDGRTYGGDGFLLVGSKPNQVVYRNGAQAAILGPQYSSTYVYDISNASLWTSDTSFMIVQYIMSASRGVPAGKPRNTGDPAMVVINPADQFGNKIIFQVPKLGGTLGGGQLDFTNYLNIVLPVSHESATTMDGKKLGAIAGTSMKKFLVPSTQWEIIQLKYNTAGDGAGNHVIVSDTGVGLYLYGYTRDDSYAWAGALGIRSTQTHDTLPPIADTSGACFCAHIKMRDNRLIDTKLNSFTVDTIYNMTFTRDPNFQDGSGTDSSYYDICVTDSSQEAYISVTTFDLAGNATTVVSTFKPSNIDFSPCPFVLSSPAVGVTVYGYDTLTNTGSSTDDAYGFIAANLKLLKGNVGFTIDSTGPDGLILPGGKRVIKIKFTAQIATGVSDTIQIFDGCQYASCTLLGSGGAADFNVPDIKFTCTIPDSTSILTNCQLINTSPGPIQVTAVTLDDNVHFKFDPTLPGNALPITIPGKNTLGGITNVTITFTPTAIGPFSTTAHFVAPAVQGGERTATVSGIGCKPAYTSTPDTVQTSCNVGVTAHIKFQNVGTYFDSLVAVAHTDKVHFATPVLEDGFGKIYTVPMRVDENQSIVADVLYTPTLKASGCFTDTIFLVSIYGDTIRGYATVCDKYYDALLQRGNINIGTVAVGGAPILDSFIVCNNGKDPLTISSIDKFLSKDSSQFQLTGLMTLNGSPVTFPITVQKGDCVTIFVTFDPALLDNAQQGFFGINSNACDQQHANLSAYYNAATSVGPPTIKGFTVPTILSCGRYPDSVTVSNSLPTDKQVTGLAITQPPSGSFTTNATFPILLPAKSSIKIPVIFTASPSTTQAYYAGYATASYVDLGQTDTATVADSVRASSGYFDLSFNHGFPSNIVHAGDLISMPINLVLKKNGLSEPLSSLGIQKIVLTYTYDFDLLNIVDPTKMFTSAIPGWTLDAANSSVNPATKVLTLTLTGPGVPLTEAMTQLGAVNFQVTLGKTGNNTTVALTSSSLLDGTSTPIPSCMALAHQDTSVTLVLQCGDSTIRRWLNGEDPTVRIIPAVPDPVTRESRSVTLSYALRIEGDVSLEVFDALGNRVARLLDRVHHPAGTFQVIYDTHNLPAGSYVYRLDFANRGVRSGRFVIER